MVLGLQPSFSMSSSTVGTHCAFGRGCHNWLAVARFRGNRGANGGERGRGSNQDSGGGAPKPRTEDFEEEESKRTIRDDLMLVLSRANTEMTTLLTTKANSQDGNTLDDCGREKLEVLEKVKGPLWMMVNMSIFEKEEMLNKMIIVLEEALDEMSAGYCSGNPQTPTVPEDDQKCDLEEISSAKNFIADLDLIISENLFKVSNIDSKKDAMIGIINLKSRMEDRLRDLYNRPPICHQEVKQIKRTYMPKLQNCLDEMMNPKISFDKKSRAERVQCVKDLRISMEARRGELLLKEVEKSIKQAQATQARIAENKEPLNPSTINQSNQLNG